MIADPRARAETQDHLAAQAARRREIHILERRGGIARLGVAQALREAPLLAGGPFRLHQQAEPVLEAQLGVLAGATLLLKSLRHRGQT